VNDTATKQPLALAARISDFQAYVAPLAIFIGFTFVGQTWSSLYPWSYLVKTVVVAATLWFCWPRYTRIRWDYWWLGLIVGVIGIFQWVGMQLYLQQFQFFKPSAESFDPLTHFQGHNGMLWAFIGVRAAGAAFLVPVMEELFWRDFLWRSIITPDFKKVAIGAWTWASLLGVAAAFSLVHGNWWLTSIVWALMIGILLVKTRSLGACIVAHATTNLLLAAYVVNTRQWFFW
jgi:CAAX prenyl protease-like protein